MRNLYLNRAIAEAVRLEMEQDPQIVLLGEDTINKGGGMSTYMGVPEQFPDRCFDMPIAESGFTHFATGAALAGMRPIVDLMFADFSALAFDAIVNAAVKHRYSTQGKKQLPITYIAANGGRGTYDGVGSGCNHSQCVENWFMNVPGIKIVAPYYPSDALGLLRSSIRDNDPVLFLYHLGSLGTRQKVEDVVEPISLVHAAQILREGTDVTIVALQSMVPVAMKAAEALQELGISAEVIDPRVLIPFDKEKVIDSLKKTGKLVVVEEAPTRGSFAGEIFSSVVQADPSLLKRPAKLLGALNSPIPSGFAEGLMMPHKEDIIESVKSLMA